MAVKIQYPGIEDALRPDLKTAGMLGRLGTVGTAIDGGGLIEELRERVLGGGDYLKEADNQRAFAALFERMPGAHVPAVVPERSGSRAHLGARPGPELLPVLRHGPKGGA